MVRNIDDIMDVRWVDGCFIGPNHLASSMGVPLGLDNPHPEHRAVVKRVLDAER